jgi:hypothetical protein
LWNRSAEEVRGVVIVVGGSGVGLGLGLKH